MTDEGPPQAVIGEGHEKELRLFSREWGVQAPAQPLLKKAFTIGVTEWARRHKSSERTKHGFIVAQTIAPVAAAIATVLAATGISKWAVIPSAIATVAASLIASFGLRENWSRLRHVTRELGFEVVQFAESYGKYRQPIEELKRIDTFMTQIEKLSIAPPAPSDTAGQPRP
jgi:hypothetical protein